MYNLSVLMKQWWGSLFVMFLFVQMFSAWNICKRTAKTVKTAEGTQKNRIGHLSIVGNTVCDNAATGLFLMNVCQRALKTLWSLFFLSLPRLFKDFSEKVIKKSKFFFVSFVRIQNSVHLINLVQLKKKKAKPVSVLFPNINCTIRFKQPSGQLFSHNLICIRAISSPVC